MIEPFELESPALEKASKGGRNDIGRRKGGGK